MYYCMENGVEPDDRGFEKWLKKQGTDFIADELDSYLFISNGGF